MAKRKNLKTGVAQGVAVTLVCAVVLLLSSLAGNVASARPSQSEQPTPTPTYDPCLQYEDVARKPVNCEQIPTPTPTPTTTTTTTVPEETTTTLPGETTTTVVGETTTTTKPAVSSAGAQKPQSGTLARTGTDSTSLFAIGLALLAAGAVVVLTVRRSQSANS